MSVFETRAAHNVEAYSLLENMFSFLRGTVPMPRPRPTEIATVGREFQRLTSSCPDDIRARGWAVAVHNDYRLNNKPHTFWLFTKGDRCIKGEGPTDEQALNDIRAELLAKKEW